MNEPHISVGTDDDPFDEEGFFRRGEATAQMGQSLEPPMGIDIEPTRSEDGELGPLSRTPEQLARRQRFIRYVSMTMGALVFGLALVFTKQFLVSPSWPTKAHSTLANPSVSTDSRLSAATPDVPKTAQVDVPKTAQVDVPKTAAQVDVPKMAQVDVTKTAQVDVPKTAQVDVPKTAQVDVTKTAQVDVTKTAQVDVTKTAQAMRPKKSVARSRSLAPLAVSPHPATPAMAIAKPENYKPPTASFSD